MESIIKGNIFESTLGSPTVVAPEKYYTRFNKSIDQYFLVSPDQWHEFGRF